MSWTKVSSPARLYNRIAVLRAERSLTQPGLAEPLHVDHQIIGYMGRGDFNPRLELAFRICEYFGIPVEAVFSGRPVRTCSEQVYGGATPRRHHHVRVARRRHTLSHTRAALWFGTATDFYLIFFALMVVSVAVPHAFIAWLEPDYLPDLDAE